MIQVYLILPLCRIWMLVSGSPWCFSDTASRAFQGYLWSLYEQKDLWLQQPGSPVVLGTAGWGKIYFLGGSEGWLLCGTVHSAPFIWVRSWGWSWLFTWSYTSGATSESHRSHPMLLLTGGCALLTLGCWNSQAVLESRLREYLKAHQP